ncbi:MAG: hypothetical protein Q7T54_06010 [Candidatus Levybacteria bacterium]|nr:hypothetical protein [Candidatus Levybacteria bacterium]
MDAERFRMIVEGPKKFEGVISQTLSEFPGFTLRPLNSGEQVDIVDISGQNEIEQRWLNEKVALTSSVGLVTQGIDQLNTATIQGFASLYQDCSEQVNGLLDRLDKKMDAETFVRSSLEIFQEAAIAFAGLEKSPAFFSSGRHRKQVTLYKKLPGVDLNPRQIRSIIGLYGLDGEEKRSVVELAETEQISISTILMSIQKLALEVAFRYC